MSDEAEIRDMQVEIERLKDRVKTLETTTKSLEAWLKTLQSWADTTTGDMRQRWTARDNWATRLEAKSMKLDEAVAIMSTTLERLTVLYESLERRTTRQESRQSAAEEGRFSDVRSILGWLVGLVTAVAVGAIGTWLALKM